MDQDDEFIYHEPDKFTAQRHIPMQQSLRDEAKPFSTPGSHWKPEFSSEQEGEWSAVAGRDPIE